MTAYIACPNGCGGEVPCEPETTDDGAADIYGASSYQVAFIDDDANATTHAPGCPPLTPEQREAVETEATAIVNEPEYWVLEP